MTQAEATRTTWVVQVPVATVWTSSESARSIDLPGVSNPSKIKEWLDQLTYETSLALSDDNLVQSQLLYGEEVIVDNIEGEWASVVIPTQPSKKDERGYPGYVPVRQLKEIPEEEWTGNGIAVVIKNTTLLIDDKGEPMFEISYLTSLPAISEEGEFIKVITPHGIGLVPAQDISIYPSREHIPKGNGEAILKAGKTFLDLPYFWGGMSSYGYDCSGFAYNMHKANGYVIPRDATDQAASGEEIKLDEVQPGDLLFFAYENGKGNIHHVGIYYGDGQMIHSPKTGKTIEIIPLKGTIYENELCSARRYWKESEDR
ncbi:C40 family peptidase [Halobacillus sp. Marseille-Q1614]|uniref:C40 family peptidase n=1 Tax=Halobacillus sp. Marseille-Q1614 TaxID=2709134 RepID=UPI0015709C05|nr:C40 family peptidase [Halobacillus sp. Marseille-Q1614]